MATFIDITNTTPASFEINESQEIEFNGTVTQEAYDILAVPIGTEEEVTLAAPTLTYPPGKRGELFIQGINIGTDNQSVGLNVQVNLVDI